MKKSPQTINSSSDFSMPWELRGIMFAAEWWWWTDRQTSQNLTPLWWLWSQWQYGHISRRAVPWERGVVLYRLVCSGSVWLVGHVSSWGTLTSGSSHQWHVHVTSSRLPGGWSGSSVTSVSSQQLGNGASEESHVVLLIFLNLFQFVVTVNLSWMTVL